MNSWWCRCGRHGIESSQPAAARALTAHLTATGHRDGEYSYGCEGQRTTVAVRLDEQGTPVHEKVGVA